MTRGPVENVRLTWKNEVDIIDFFWKCLFYIYIYIYSVCRQYKDDGVELINRNDWCLLFEIVRVYV